MDKDKLIQFEEDNFSELVDKFLKTRLEEFGDFVLKEYEEHKASKDDYDYEMMKEDYWSNNGFANAEDYYKWRGA